MTTLILVVMVLWISFTSHWHNEHMGWGFTNVMTDDMDFYIESLNEDQTQYYLEEWRDLLIEEEEITLKSGDIRKITIRSTHRGPIIRKYTEMQKLK
ncbi:MAG: hypothetical protein Ct9H90mP22_8420 [Gammaproteobacteria bacterium]|nr:MAG: hypothetical protein Ct9H90mP22_8420 [Gammaproteobacteria bacterium]